MNIVIELLYGVGLCFLILVGLPVVFRVEDALHRACQKKKKIPPVIDFNTAPTSFDYLLGEMLWEVFPDDFNPQTYGDVEAMGEKLRTGLEEDFGVDDAEDIWGEDAMRRYAKECWK